MLNHDSSTDADATIEVHDVAVVHADAAPRYVAADGLRIVRAGRSAWFIGTLVIIVYAVFALTLYLLPPRVP